MDDKRQNAAEEPEPIALQDVYEHLTEGLTHSEEPYDVEAGLAEHLQWASPQTSSGGTDFAQLEQRIQRLERDREATERLIRHMQAELLAADTDRPPSEPVVHPQPRAPQPTSLRIDPAAGGVRRVWRRLMLRREGRLDGRRAQPDPSSTSLPSGMGAILEQELIQALAELDSRVAVEEADLLRHKTQLDVQAEQLLQRLTDVDAVLPEVETRYRDAREASGSAKSEQRIREEWAAVTSIGRRRERAQQQLEAVEQQRAMVHADLEGLHHQSEARRRQLCEAFRHDQVIYEQSRLRATGPRGASAWRRAAGYAVLAVVGIMDVILFGTVLTKLVRQDIGLVWVFSVALGIGAIATTNEIGRLLRARAEGYFGSLTWILILATAWVGLAATMTWLTATLAPGLGSASQANVAILLAIGLLLSGLLAVTQGYLYGDPRSAELRSANAERSRLAEALAARQQELRTEARTVIARHLGDPSSPEESDSAASTTLGPSENTK